jgi:hypothetical protein
MASPANISRAVREQVRRRAHYLCEYCHASERWQYSAFTMDHIVPLSQGGSNDTNNLALACFPCNRRKSDRQEIVDPETGASVRLFHPRQDQWAEHFIWSSDGITIIGRTAIGRATVEALELNRERARLLRAADQAVGRHPPEGDRLEPSE